MTMTVTAAGETCTVTKVDVVELAFRQAGYDPTKLGAGFIRYWLEAGKTVDEILDIAGAAPGRRSA